MGLLFILSYSTRSSNLRTENRRLAHNSNKKENEVTTLSFQKEIKGKDASGWHAKFVCNSLLLYFLASWLIACYNLILYGTSDCSLLKMINPQTQTHRTLGQINCTFKTNRDVETILDGEI